MKKILLSVLLVMSALSLRAQLIDRSTSFTVSADGVVSGPITYHDGKLLNSVGYPISKEQGLAYFQGAQYDAFVKATNKTRAANILNNVGAYFIGASIGYPIGWMLSGHRFKDSLKVAGILLGCSAPFLAVGIPLWNSGKKTLVGIASDYNESIEDQSYAPTLHFGSTPNGFGLALNF